MFSFALKIKKKRMKGKSKQTKEIQNDMGKLQQIN